MKKILWLSVVVLSTMMIFGQNPQKYSAPVSLPFLDPFDETESNLNWTLHQPENKNIFTFYNCCISQPDGGDTGGALSVLVHKEDEQGGYMVTSNPIVIPATGIYHLSFLTFNITPHAPKGNHSLRILYGLSPNPEEMNLLADYPDFYYECHLAIDEDGETNYNGYLKSIINFEIATSGNYYFAFHFYTDSEIAALAVKYMEIDAGALEVAPDISLKKIIMPLGGCSLNPGNVGATVWNRGNKPITEFTLSYQIEEETPVSQIFNKNIGVREKTDIYFDQLIDFSTFSKKSVKFLVSTSEDDYLKNNERTLSLANFDPVTTLPFNSNFLQTTGIKNWYPFKEDAWLPWEGLYWANKHNVPLLSRCVSLEPNLYRFSYSYVSGSFEFVTFGILYFPDFYLTYGKTGSDPYTWKPAKYHTVGFSSDSIQQYGVFTKYNLVESDFLVNITEPGEYEFAIFPLIIHDKYAQFMNLGIQQTSLSKVPEHDFRIKEVDFTRMIPVNQAKKGCNITAIVENRGKTPNENGIIQLLHNNNIVASENFAFTKVGEILNINFQPAFEFASVGKMLLKIHASNQKDIHRTLDITLQISDSTFAGDFADKNFSTSAGNPLEAMDIGMIFELQKKDILTSINIGFQEVESNFLFGLAVYPVNDNFEVGERIFLGDYYTNGGNNSRAFTFKVPDTELQPGKYYFEIINYLQNETSALYVATDFELKGYFYGNINGKLVANGYQGSLHLRPNFGKSSPNLLQNKNNFSEFILYPNPTSGILNIETPNIDLIPEVKICSIQGMLLINTKGNRIDISSLPRGLYFADVNGQTMKVVKQ